MSLSLAASLIMIVLSSMLWTSETEAQEVSDRARKLFRAGVAMLQDPSGPRYEDAHEMFRAAYRDSPSPKILGNLGLCAMKLEREGEAIDALSRYLTEVKDIHPEERAQYETDLATLQAGVATVVLLLSPAGVMISDERTTTRGSVVNRYGPGNGENALRLRAGLHKLTMTLQGHASQTLTLNLRAGDRVRRAASLAPMPAAAPSPLGPRPVGNDKPAASLPLSFLVGLGVTGVLGATTGILGGFAADTHADYENALATGDAERASDLRSRGEILNNAGDVALGLTAAAALTTAVLLLVGETSPAAKKLERARLYPPPTSRNALSFTF